MDALTHTGVVETELLHQSRGLEDGVELFDHQQQQQPVYRGRGGGGGVGQRRLLLSSLEEQLWWISVLRLKTCSGLWTTCRVSMASLMNSACLLLLPVALLLSEYTNYIPVMLSKLIYF